MINICPAILTNNIAEFERQIKIYTKIASQVDIDINDSSDFVIGNETLLFEDFVDIVRNIYYDGIYGFHLMSDYPFEIIKSINSDVKIKYKFYIHQEVKWDLRLNNEEIREKLAIVINPDTVLKDIEYYNQFNEVQFMTVIPGKQGAEFRSDVLSKVDNLRKLGYLGIISIDGGVNVERSNMIKRHKIDRVSVGSYLSKSITPEKDFDILKVALN
jgi:pentose-5-phosphate-3-epimerase